MQQPVTITIPANEMNRDDLNKLMNKSIFRPEPSDSKIKAKMKQKMIDYLNKSHPGKVRFMRIHSTVKAHMVYPGIRLLRRVLGKHMVQGLDNIPSEWYNSHHRMFYWCWERALEDEWRLHYYDTNPDNPNSIGMTQDEFYEKTKKSNKSHIFRMDIINIWMTEILEDTVDREWLNFFSMRFTHEMMKFYGVSPEEMKKVPKSGEFPIYMSGIQVNPPYFLMNRHRKIWNPAPAPKKPTAKEVETELNSLREFKKNKEEECEFLKKELEKAMQPTNNPKVITR